jgi:hypothetical protein
MRFTIALGLAGLLIVSCNQSGTTTKSESSKTDSAVVAAPRHDTLAQEIGNLPQSITQFVPEGYAAIDTTKGDLNLDAYDDMIVVLKKDGEKSTSNYANGKPERRPLLILTGKAGGTYRLQKRNDNVVLCMDCGTGQTDPFSGIAIKRGYFSVEHGMGGGANKVQVITFKYDKTKGDWLLHQDGAINYKFNDSTDDYAEDLEKENEQIRRRKDFGIVPFEKFDVYSRK